jgi:hypothetical protein
MSDHKGFLEAERAVDDGEFRRLQATFDKVIEKCPPGGFALPADILDRQKNLLAVLPDAEQRVDVAFRSGRTRTPSRRGSTGRSAHRRANGHSKRPNRPLPWAKPG